MKIRVMGTRPECEQVQIYYNSLAKSDNVDYCTVSDLYPNRGSKNMFRVYIDIAYKPDYTYSVLVENALAKNRGQKTILDHLRVTGDNK